MPDIGITQSAIVAQSNAVKVTGTSGAAITAGQAVYADPNDTYRIKPAQANSANPTHAPNLVGVALDNAPGQNQPVTYATAGDVSYGSGLTTGTIYVVSSNAAGAVAPSADLGATNFVAVLGVATSSSLLHLGLLPTSAQK